MDMKWRREKERKKEKSQLPEHNDFLGKYLDDMKLFYSKKKN